MARKVDKKPARSRVIIQVIRGIELREHLRQVIDLYFFGSLLQAARLTDIPQPTLWRILNGQEEIEAKTVTRLRRLLHGLDDETWRALFWSGESAAALTAYQDAIDTELRSHSTGYGMALEDWSGTVLSAAAEERINAFHRRAIRQGHHPQRVLLAIWRIRAPFILGHFGGGLEPSAQDLRGRGEELRVVKLGIEREKVLLRLPPKILQSGRAVGSPLQK